MAEPKQGFESHVGYSVTIHRGDGTAIRLEDGGEPYYTRDPQEIDELSQHPYVKAATSPEKSKSS